MSLRIAVEQRRYVAGLADIEGLQFETCSTTPELRMRIKYARTLSFFIMWAVICTNNGGQNRYGLV